MAFRKSLYLILLLFATVIAQEFSPSNDPDCDQILDQESRFPPSNAIVTRCCDGRGVRYVCINGYRMVSGNTVRICNQSRLNGQEPTCEFPEVLSCGNPGPIEHGYFIGSDFTISSRVIYSCFEGFKMYGREHRTCMDSGRWTEPPSCIFEDEQEMDLTNATDIISNNLLHHLDLLIDEAECPECEPSSRRKRAVDEAECPECEPSSRRKRAVDETECPECEPSSRRKRAVDETECPFCEQNSRRRRAVDETECPKCEPSSHRKRSVDESECPFCKNSRRRRAIDVDHGGELDIVFMFDGSDSIRKGEFKMGLRFARDLLRILDGTVRRGGVRVAVLSFADNMRINLELTPSSLRTIRKIGSIKRPSGCGSNLGRTMFLLRKRIAPKLRPTSKRALFIITNGKLVMGTGHKRAARLLKTENRFEVFVIGVGKNPNKDMLSTLVSEPVKEHFIGLKGFSDVFTSVTKTVLASKDDYNRCGISSTKLKSRSIRGNKAASGIWPWQVDLYWGRGLLPHCGGVLVSDRWVLTAASCFYANSGTAITFPPWRYTVKVGEHGKRVPADTKQMAPADSIFIHKDFHFKNHENDLALVKLQYKFKLGKHVRPVCLPEVKGKRRKDVESGQHGFVLEGKRQYSRSRVDRLHQAEVVTSANQCKNMTSKPFNSSKMFCIMDKKSGKKDCRWDGGSAFVTESYDQHTRSYRWSVDGLLSYDVKCGKPDHHTYFTSILPYLKWIDRAMKEAKSRRRRL